MQNKSFNNSDIFIAVNDANQRSHQEIEFVTWIFYSHLMYVSDTFQTPFVGIRSVCAVLLFDKNMQDRKYLHTVSWIGQYPCIRMNESMSGVQAIQVIANCHLCVCVSALAICVEDERVIFKSSVTKSLYFISPTLLSKLPSYPVVMHLYLLNKILNFFISSKSSSSSRLSVK